MLRSKSYDYNQLMVVVVSRKKQLVPGFFECRPSDSPEMEWDVFKRYVLQEESKLPRNIGS
jgi:hypothetical protein